MNCVSNCYILTHVYISIGVCLKYFEKIVIFAIASPWNYSQYHDFRQNVTKLLVTGIIRLFS